MKYIYILANPNNQKYILVGCSEDVEKALKQVNKIDFKPCLFRIFAFYQCGETVEQEDVQLLIQKWFPETQSVEMNIGNATIQFYEMHRSDALQMLRVIAKLSGTTKSITVNSEFDLDNTDKARFFSDDIFSKEEKESRFRFSDCGISVGEIIEYKFNHKIKATVYDDTHVLFEGAIMNLTTLARKIAGRDSKNGPRDFQYKGQTLAVIRREKRVRNS